MPKPSPTICLLALPADVLYKISQFIEYSDQSKLLELCKASYSRHVINNLSGLYPRIHPTLQAAQSIIHQHNHLVSCLNRAAVMIMLAYTLSYLNQQETTNDRPTGYLRASQLLPGLFLSRHAIANALSQAAKQRLDKAFQASVDQKPTLFNKIKKDYQGQFRDFGTLPCTLL